MYSQPSGGLPLGESPGGDDLRAIVAQPFGDSAT
jgi:hypothetical protein